LYVFPDVILSYCIESFFTEVKLMNKVTQLFAIAFVGIILAHTASAEVGITADIGTLGYGGDITVGLCPELNVRAGINVLKLTLNGSAEGKGGVPTQLTGKIDFQTIPILLDWHPWASAFRISAGVMVNNNEIGLSAEPGDSVTFNHVTYMVSSVSGKATFDKVAPYVGIGAGNAAASDGHWHFSCDIGVLFQGVPHIDLSAVAGNPMQQQALNYDVAEQQRIIQDDAKLFNVYPVIAAGVSYTF